MNNGPVEIDIVSVRIVKDDTPKPVRPERPTNLATVPVVIGAPAMLVGHAPGRRQLTLSVCGLAADTAVIYRKGDGGQDIPAGMLVQGGMVLHLHSTNELWVVGKSGNSLNIGVSAEFEQH